MKKILMILLCGIIILGVATGCGTNDPISIKDDLNNLMNKMENEESNFHVSTIQEYLEKNSDYRLIAGNNEPFTSKPDTSKDQYTSVQKREQLINTSSNYVLIYNIKTDKYYSIPVGAVGHKPYFNEVTELN